MECSAVDLRQMETDSNVVGNNMKKIRREYDKIEKEMREGGKDEDGTGEGRMDRYRKEANENFLQKIGPFLLRGEQNVEQFKKQFEGVKEDVTKNIEMFGEEMKNWNADKVQNFYRHISDFCKAYNKAKVENQQILDNLEREAKREKEKKKRAAKAEAKGGEKGGEKGGGKGVAPPAKDLFSAFKQSQHGTTNEIVDEMRLKMAKRRAKAA